MNIYNNNYRAKHIQVSPSQLFFVTSQVLLKLLERKSDSSLIKEVLHALHELAELMKERGQVRLRYYGPILIRQEMLLHEPIQHHIVNSV